MHVPSLAQTNSAFQPVTDYNNWVEFSLGGYAVSGDNAQFMSRHNVRGNKPFGGIEDLHVERPVGRGLFTVDGRVIYDNHDYLIKLGYTQPEKGFVRVGYREFRTWYDGSGGFFPPNEQWFSLYDDELALDRGEVWFEAGLTLPDFPLLTFRYSHEFRDGRKDSLIWGDSNLTGGFGTRGIVPTFRDIDEERDRIEADLKHTLGNTDFGVGLRYEWIENDNSLNIRRRPGEAPDRHLTQREMVEMDLFNVHAFTETRFSERVFFTTGYSFTTLDTDVGGSRLYGSDYDPIYDPVFARRQRFDEGFFDLEGGSQVDQHVFNVNLMLTPCDDFTIVPAIRVERQDQDGSVNLIETVVQPVPPPAGPLTTIEEPFFNHREWNFLDVSESLEARYTGFQNWALYARGEWLQGDGDLRERVDERDTETGGPGNPPVVTLERDSESCRFTQKYVVGANWYPLRRLNFGFQYYHKIRENDYDHELDSTPNASANRYPAYLVWQDFETDDLNVRMTVRPLNNLTLVSRYDFQLSTIHTMPDSASGLDKVQTAETTSHIFSQSITWSPWNRIYLQGGINYALDETETPAVNATPGTLLVPNINNDYWNANASIGYALDERTDVQANYFYYCADNYVNNSAFSQPFGAETEEHGVTIAVSRWLRENLRWTLKYGFFNHTDRTSGGNNNFDAHLVYSSVQFRF